MIASLIDRSLEESGRKGSLSSVVSITGRWSNHYWCCFMWSQYLNTIRICFLFLICLWDVLLVGSSNILYTASIPPPISSTKSQPVPPCTNLFFVQPYLGIQKYIHSGPWLCSEMMLPCILGLGCNFVEAPFVWAGFWFCNGSTVQTHFVENTGKIEIVFHYSYLYYIKIYHDISRFFLKSEPPYKIRIPL